MFQINFFALTMVLIGILLGPYALGARKGVVEDPDTKVYEEPSKKSEVIATLDAKTEVAASNLPTLGFHKVRTPKGDIGWVEASALVLSNPPTAEELAEAGAPDPKEEERRREQDRTESKLAERPGYMRHRVRIKALGGVNLFTASGIVTNFNNLSQGYGVGGEFVWQFSIPVGFVLRVENISKSFQLSDSGTGKSFRIDLSSTPIMGGLNFNLVRGPRATLQVDLLGGVGSSTTVTSTNLSDAPPPTNVSTSSNSPFSGLLKVNVLWFISRYFSGFIEGGYRYLVTAPLTPVTGNGALILNSSFNVNLSGIVIGGGIGVNF